MAVKKQVFASVAERGYYYKLSRQWGQRYRLYHNLPFLQVFEIDASLNNTDANRLKKTSIDFTLCDEGDRPLICIEFDGMQEGFNVGTAYMTSSESNSWRTTITELKISVAHREAFPYFVMGSKYFDDISNNIRLRIVDGIIGEVFAAYAVEEFVAQGFKPEDIGMTEQEFGQLHTFEQDELIQDWFTGVEVAADMENNPIIQARWELLFELERKLGTINLTVMPIYPKGMDNATSMKERAAIFDSAPMHGASCVVRTGQFGVIERKVYLPNFKSPRYSGLELGEEIAQLMALDALKRCIGT